MAMSKEEILVAIKEMSVLDLSDLVKTLEEEFGVSAAAPVAVAAPTSAGDGAAADERHHPGRRRRQDRRPRLPGQLEPQRGCLAEG